MSTLTTGRVGNLTPSQESTLTQLREFLIAEGHFVPERHDDYCLLRFLRARKFHLPSTKKMFVAYEKWRKEFQVDEVVKNFKFTEAAEVQKIYPRFYHKTDKEGRPIYIEQLGKLEPKKLLAITNEERLTKDHIISYETLLSKIFPACSAKAGHHIESSCTIIDLKGASLVSFPQAVGIVKRISVIAQNYYPELLGRMFIINAPLLFSSIWKVIVPFLDEATVKKIFIVGSSYKSKLAEYIDLENIPSFLHGKCNCEGGCQFSNVGPWNESGSKL